MGAHFQERGYQDCTERQMIKEYDWSQKEAAYESGHCYSGDLGSAPEGVNVVREDNGKVKKFKTFDEAFEWLADNHVKWDRAMAVNVKNKRTWAVGCWCSS